MPAKQETTREATEHDLRAFKMFRECYIAFMDECSRIWHSHCHHVADASRRAAERLAAAGAAPSADAVTALQTELSQAYRSHVDRLLGELQRSLDAYSKGNASAWSSTEGQKQPEWLLWHVAAGQANVAATYSTLLRAIGS